MEMGNHASLCVLMLVWNIRLKSKHFNVVALVVFAATVVNNTRIHKIPLKIKSIKLIKWFGHYFHFIFSLFSTKLCCGTHNCGVAKILPELCDQRKKKL